MLHYFWIMPNPWTGKGNPYTRKEVIERLHETVKEGNAIIAAGAGTGISAKFIERGGGDLIIIYKAHRPFLNSYILKESIIYAYNSINYGISYSNNVYCFLHEVSVLKS